MCRWLAVLLFSIAAFYAAVCTPLYHIFNSDILLRDTVLPQILDVIMLVLNYAFYWISFSFLIYAATRIGISYCKPFYVIYASAVVFRYLANLVSGFLTMGIPLWREIQSDYLPYFFLDILLDLLMMGILIGLLYALVRRFSLYNNYKRDQFFAQTIPFAKFVDSNNPVWRMLLWVSLIPSALQLLSRIRYDIFYGVPKGWIDLAWIIVGYTSDIAFFLFGVIAMLWGINHLYILEEKARQDDCSIFSEMNQ